MEETEASPWRVLKFGGSSVAEARNWPTIAGRIEAHLAAGERPLVVCSALAGVSDLLEGYLAVRARGQDGRAALDRVIERHREFARSLAIDAEDLLERSASALAALPLSASTDESPAARAEGMALGEILSTRIGARWLLRAGLPVRWRDARTLLRSDPPPLRARASQRFLSARCSGEPDPALRRELAGDPAVITQGFIASDADGRTVLLGRGGSDTAAAVLAARLGAAGIAIYSDVPGIFTANPRQVPHARLIPRLGFDEAETIAALGAQVLHPRTLGPLRGRGLPLELRWIADPEREGTVLLDDPGETEPGPRAVAARRRLCLVSCRRPFDWQPIGRIAEVANCFREHAISMDLIESSPSHIQATIDLAADPDLPLRVPALARALEECCEATVREGVASVSLVGRRIRSQFHRLQPLLDSLRTRELLLLHSAADDRSLSLVVPVEEARDLVADLHATFFENGPGDGAAGLGPRWVDLEREVAGARAAAREREVVHG